ncbi:MAG: MoaD/ThiS family protein [Anaerolineae bacterium]|nr:MoaD/ThiS family protein [Anaerolineae bacterium]
MKVTVEFAGMARLLTRTPRVTLELDDSTSFSEILRMLGERHPELVGEVISPTFDALKASNMLNVNGKHMVQPAQMDQGPTDGDRLILMSILAGG